MQAELDTHATPTKALLAAPGRSGVRCRRHEVPFQRSANDKPLPGGWYSPVAVQRSVALHDTADSSALLPGSLATGTDAHSPDDSRVAQAAEVDPFDLAHGHARAGEAQEMPFKLTSLAPLGIARGVSVQEEPFQTAANAPEETSDPDV